MNDGKIQGRRIDPGLGRAHAVSHRTMAADAEILVDLVSPGKSGGVVGYGLGTSCQPSGNLIVQPLDIGVGPGFIGRMASFFQKTLPFHAPIGLFEPQTLNITGQRH